MRKLLLALALLFVAACASTRDPLCPSPRQNFGFWEERVGFAALARDQGWSLAETCAAAASPGRGTPPFYFFDSASPTGAYLCPAR